MEKKRAIIIGATSGIGRGLASILVQNNYIVGITGRREELLDELKSQFPNLCYVKQFDVTKTELIVQNLEELTKEIGGLDLLIISSGTGDINKTLDFQIEKLTIETNVMGYTCIADWAFNYFEKQKYGHLVGISSIAGIRGSRTAPAYNASKSFQINYLEGLRQKATKNNLKIFVTDVRPGLVNTAMAKGDGLFWVMPVEKVVKQIFCGIEKKKKIMYVTKRWTLIAIILKILPNFISDKILE